MTKHLGGFGRRPGRRSWWLAAAVLAVGVSGFATAAYGAATLTATPDTGLTNGQSVTLSGSGFTKSSIGNVLECNNATGQPTVAVGSPINSSISVGCTAPSLSKLVTTSATGTVSTTYDVVSGTIGPPCGAAPAAATCPATDSAGKSPAADAANYPCPPTAAQQATGVTCSLSYGDAAGDTAAATIQFQGASTTTTSPGSSTTGAGTGTTAAGTATTVAGSATTTAGGATAAGSGSSGASGSTAVTGASGSSAGATATAATPGAVAMTGPGPALWLLLLAGVVLMNVGALLWFGPPWSWRRRRLRDP
jgi:hypothetical protein